MKREVYFNPHKVAYYEKSGWEAYYDRDWVRAFKLMVALNREEFHMPLLTAVTAALDIVRASIAFAPVDNDVPKATVYLRRFYEKARRTADLPTDAATLARLEMDYWVVHRNLAIERKKNPDLENIAPMLESLTSLHAALFGVSGEAARRSAELRALAAKAVDRITGRYSADVAEDWRQVETYLQQAYQAVLSTKSTYPPVAPDLEAARALLKRDRAQGWSALNSLFRAGRLPEPPLEGRYAGELVALDLAPGLTEFFQVISRSWMPWLGKTFTSSKQQGDNLFSNDSRFLARSFNPFYRGFAPDQPGMYRAFSFRTYSAPGLADPDKTVLKIDYALKSNPPLTVSRVLDELVQISEKYYLGKAHVHWWWGRWQTVAFFTLSGDKSPGST